MVGKARYRVWHVMLCVVSVDDLISETTKILMTAAETKEP
jgi:hypothetical protein